MAILLTQPSSGLQPFVILFMTQCKRSLLHLAQIKNSIYKQDKVICMGGAIHTSMVWVFELEWNFFF